MSDLEPTAGAPVTTVAGESSLPSGLSIASMVCGIAGVLFSFAGLGFLPALAAVITGHMARSRDPQAKPFWLTGLISGYVGIGLSVIVGLFIVVTAAAFFLTISGVLGRYY